MGWVYNLGLATLLKKYVHDHKDQLEEKLNLDAVAECWTIRHFEESVLCELFGYKNIHECAAPPVGCPSEGTVRLLSHPAPCKQSRSALRLRQMGLAGCS